MEDGIRINTTQNVLISYQPAGVGDRILASLLDSLFTIAYVVLVLIFVGVVTDKGTNDGMGVMAMFTLLSLPVMFYNLLMEQFFNGQSLGKKIMKIKVLKLDGSQPNFGAYLVRWVFRIVDIMLFNGLVALITVAVSENAQRLGDMAAGTTVVSLKQKVSLQNTILYRPRVEHKIVFHEVNKLSDKDVGIIKEVFEHCTKNSDYIGLKQLVIKVQTKMEITSSMPDSQFIKVVLLDYSQYQFEK
jgi:uncharacterized RDD family membrane protein YckC